MPGQDFYPRPPRGGRQGGRHSRRSPHRISIHALREEGDLRSSHRFRRSPGISIHALREEGDNAPAGRGRRLLNFYPRPPRGGRPSATAHHGKQRFISIHALREEGDCSRWLAKSPEKYFYPRPPRGGRRFASMPSSSCWRFLSTPSARRATSSKVSWVPDRYISIHALREEGDLTPWAFRVDGRHFYPRPPRGGRHWASLSRQQMKGNFYPRPPRGGRQQKQRQKLYFQTNYTTFCTNLEEP